VYGTVSLVQPFGHSCVCSATDSARVAYDKKGLSRLATAESAGSSLKTAEPQACGVCFAKRQVVDLVSHPYNLVFCTRETVGATVLRRNSYAKFVTCLPVITSQVLQAG